MGSNAIPSLANPGGVPASPLQTALNQYTLGQGEIAGATQFGQSGIGMGTGETQAAVSGPEVGFFTGQGRNAIQNSAAIQNFVNSQAQGLASGLGRLPGLLGSAGKLFGKGG